MKLLFGTAGIPIQVKKKGIVEGLVKLKEIGLDGMELEFVRGMRLSDEKLIEIKKTAEKYSLFISAHAPYYINLASKEDEKIIASRKRIIESVRACILAGGYNIVFHAGYYQGENPDKIAEIILEQIRAINNELKIKNIKNYILRPEVTGKPSQFGSLEELNQLSEKFDNVYPCIDFSHLYARTCGKINHREGFMEILDIIKVFYGENGLNDLHCHVSGIEYTSKGEKKHLPLKESDFDYEALMSVLAEYNAGGRVICESPLLEEDALLLKEKYNYYREKFD